MLEEAGDLTVSRHSRQSIGRRQLVHALAGSLVLPYVRCQRPVRAEGRRVVVLGLDGLDPKLVRRLIQQGRGRNFERLARMGTFAPLRTTMPALSPVAWSSFITGLDPAGHGIVDFIARDPVSYAPFFSIWEAQEPSRVLTLGSYRLPLESPKVINRRYGTPFWAYLTRQGIPAVILKIPTNFPVEDTATRSLAGMGTPDLVDSFGLFHYYTSDPDENYPDLTGGEVIHLSGPGPAYHTFLYGPVNTLRKNEQGSGDSRAGRTRIPLVIHVDPTEQAVRIDIQGQTILLRQREYSPWIRLRFELLGPLSTVAGIARFYLKQAHPRLQLYVTPINIDPADQAMPVTHPESYGEELAHALGPFWTKGLPADTKAFDHGVLDDEGYVKQAELILKERLALFHYEWSRFREGLFFFYVSSTDQDAHMLWRNMDESHPMHRASDLRYSGYLLDLYEQMDRLVGEVLQAADDRTWVLICSDHGFAPFGRQFHLNTWLRQQGYLVLKPQASRKSRTSWQDIDWSQTLAYGIGFNALYINQEGREAAGKLTPAQRDELAQRLKRELEALRDPDTGQRPVARVYLREEIYRGDLLFDMPDLLVGYTPGYRVSSSSVLGETGSTVIEVNPYPWSGDHSMARDWIPGCLFSSIPLRMPNPSILDLPVSILAFFGIPKPPHMLGRNLLEA